MKYYAVTDDPRELYHYGVKGMKWGQHIFGPEPGLKKSDAYRKAQQKLKTLSTKTSKATKAVVNSVKKAPAQISYNRRAAQQNRFNKRAARDEKRIAKIDAKIDKYFENKPIRDAKRQIAVAETKKTISNILGTTASAIKKSSAQISYNVKRKQQEQYNKAVQRANDRNKLSETLRNLDKDNKLYKQAERERKFEALQEKQADVRADNDLKTLSKAVRVEKNMPKYYQQARTGTLPYGKLSDEQVERLQNRLALEWNTRRLGNTEKPSWREQKKQARREGYLQGITKGTAAAMEEVARAGVQYGVKNLANRKKLDKASEYKAAREKQANRIKNQKSKKEMREDVKQEAYKAQVEAGVHAIQRGALSTRQAARQLQYAKNLQNAKQEKLAAASEQRALDRAAESAYKYGYLPAGSGGGKGKGGGGNNKPQYHQGDVTALKEYYKQANPKLVLKDQKKQAKLTEKTENKAIKTEAARQQFNEEWNERYGHPFWNADGTPYKSNKSNGAAEKKPTSDVKPESKSGENEKPKKNPFTYKDSDVYGSSNPKVGSEKKSMFDDYSPGFDIGQELRNEELRRSLAKKLKQDEQRKQDEAKSRKEHMDDLYFKKSERKYGPLTNEEIRSYVNPNTYIGKTKQEYYEAAKKEWERAEKQARADRIRRMRNSS